MSQSNEQPNAPIEWLCGLVTIPLRNPTSADAVEPLQSLIWMIPNGPVLGETTLEPGEAEAAIIDHFHATTKTPLIGKPHQPGRIRVAAEALAQVLRKELSPNIEIVCAPTPEFDTLVAGMIEFMHTQQPASDPKAEQSVAPEVLAGLFGAAAQLYREKPWTAVPADVPIVVDIESLELTGAALIVMGHGQHEYGFLLFASTREFAAFLSAAKSQRPSARPPMPLYALEFQRGADIPIELRQQAAAHGWPVADPNAYPVLSAFDAQLMPHPPTVEQLQQAAAIARALTEFTQQRRRAQSANEPVPNATTCNVQTHGRDVQVTLSLQTTVPPVDPAQHAHYRPARPRAATTKKGKRRY